MTDQADRDAAHAASTVTGPIVLAAAVRAADVVRARVDNDDLTPVGYDGYGAAIYQWQVGTEWHHRNTTPTDTADAN